MLGQEHRGEWEISFKLSKEMSFEQFHSSVTNTVSKRIHYFEPNPLAYTQLQSKIENTF